ncbi:hypothetical protein AAHE18_14G157500 [Arachis hypogaea]
MSIRLLFLAMLRAAFILSSTPKPGTSLNNAISFILRSTLSFACLKQETISTRTVVRS